MQNSLLRVCFISFIVVPVAKSPFLFICVSVRALLVDRLGRMLTGSTIPKKMEQYGLIDISTDYGSAPVCWGGYVGKLVYEVCQQNSAQVGITQED